LGVLQSISRTDESGKRFAISMDIEATRLLLELLVVLLAALLLFANFFINEAELSWLRNFLVFFGLALAIFGILQRLTWNGKYYWLIEPSSLPMAPFGSFVNHNHFAGYLEMIVPIPVALILVRAISIELSLFYGFAAVMMSVAIFFSLSRGGMISLVAGLVFVIAFGIKGWGRMREDRRWASIVLPRLGAVLLIIGTIGVGVWWVGGDAVIDRAAHTDLTGEAPDNTGKETFLKSRGWIWRDTVTMIRANWMTGVGLGAFETAYSLYSQHNGSMIVSQSHNDYLQVVADGGVAGGIIAAWFLIVLLRDFTRALRSRSEMGIGMALGCCGGIVAMLVHSIFDFNLQLPSNALLFLALTAVVSNLGSVAISGKVGRSLLNRAVGSRPSREGDKVVKRNTDRFKTVSGRMATWTLSLCVLVASFTPLAFGQDPAPRSGVPTTNRTGDTGGDSSSQMRQHVGPDVIVSSDEDYRLAPSDVIEVIIQDATELSGFFTISSAGSIAMYYLGTMSVTGKTPVEVGKAIADGLKGRYLKDPKVFVSVAKYNSRTFFIQGAVKAPGVYVIQGKPSLFKLITIAGGLQEKHGSIAYVVREKKASPEKLENRGQNIGAKPEPQRTTPVSEVVENAKGSNVGMEGESEYELLRAQIGGLMKGRFDQNVLIQPGDVVFIPPAEVFYVAGEVRSPGQYQYKEGMTLRQAITLAQGTYFKAKLDKGIIFREDPLTGKFNEISVDIGAVISKGGKDDIPIFPNDVVLVPNSAVKTVAGALLMAMGTGLALRIPTGR
ncbi:MAG: O-antigen ligase family protein, partial [Blastocatellia bacterium]